VTSRSGLVCVTYHERRRCGLAGIGLVAAGRAVAAARVGDAAIGVQREGSEAGGQEAEAEASADGAPHCAMLASPRANLREESRPMTALD
jgi:hypothetical protein